MNAFARKNGSLHAEDVPVARIAAEVGTPCYVYSRAALRESYGAYARGFGKTPHVVCYSVKACSNIAILRVLAKEGAGFDVVSGGELARVIRAGGDPAKVVFSGVGKTEEEVRQALTTGILMFNVESPGELDVIDRAARALGKRAPVALRINPDVDPKTHPYISTGLRSSKFGISIERAFEDYARARTLAGIEIVGADCHIGSQLTSVEPFREAVGRMLTLVDRLIEAGIPLRYLDMGGGLGITYNAESPPTHEAYTSALVAALGSRKLTVLVEPGRSIVGNAGILLTRVLYHKTNYEKNFVVVDAAMNDLARPALYDAYHAIEAAEDGARPITADIVGPICETGDFFARGREVPSVPPGGLMVIRSAGAYGFSMSSNYNTRPRAAEVLVDGARFDVIRRRETLEDLLAPERIPASLD
ncbi:MAG TPA: diaminopimelate decarboxylase [Candidatus Binatia bacterium]|nr:diaminopimelate decarboxylase [Candidatus Binatia bacterium]